MPASRPLYTRLTERLTEQGSCLVWTGAVSTSGYGVIGVAKGTDYVHRVAYRLAKGAIPPNLQIDHLCRNRLCCNPDHLEAITQAENVRRENLVRWGNRSTCPQGHDIETWRRTLPSGRKYCKKCSQNQAHKRHGKAAAKDQLVTMTLGDLAALLTGERKEERDG